MYETSEGGDKRRNVPTIEGYYSDKKEITVVESWLEEEWSARSIGHEVGHHLRDQLCPADEMKDRPVSEFFGHLGGKITLENYGGDPYLLSPSDMVCMLKDVKLHCSPDESPRDVRKKIWEEAADGLKNDRPGRIWQLVAWYVGSKAADENYPDALADKNLIYKKPKEIRERYGLLEMEYEAFEEMMVSE